MPETLTTWLDKINMGNFSGEVCEIVREELKNKEIVNSTRSEALNSILSDDEAREKFVRAYEVQLKKVLTEFPKEFVLQLGEEQKVKFATYVNDALNKFKVSTAGIHVEKLLAPVMGSGIISFAEDAIKEHLQSQIEQLKVLANKGLSFLSKEGIDFKEMGEAELSKAWFSLKDVLSDNDLNAVVLNNVLLKVKELIVTNSYIISTEENLEAKMVDEFERVAIEAKEVAKRSFNVLKKDLENLVDNEQVVSKVLETFEEEIRNTRDLIREYEAEIFRLAKAGNEKLIELGEKQIKHAQLVAENLLHTNILNAYLQKGVRIVESIKDYEDQANRVFSGEYLEKFRTKLEELRKPTLSGVVKFASGTLDHVGQISNTLGNLGIISKKSAQNVGKFVGYAKLAIGIATALLPPNPIGIIGALGSLGGFFGGGGPTIEEEMFKAMQEGFTQLNERLDEIEKRIDRLTDLVQAMYKDIMNSLQVISNDLDQIKETLDLIAQMLNLIIYKDYNLVEEMINIREKGELIQHKGLAYYRAWYKRDENFGRALSELSAIITSSRTLRSYIREEIIVPGEERKIRVIGIAELRAYNKTLALFKKIFSKNGEVEERTKNLLLLPPQNNSVLTFYSGSELMPQTTVYNFEAVTENYFNGRFIAKLVDQYHILHPFFIIGSNNRFEPFATLEELLLESDGVRGKLGGSIGRWQNLLDVVNDSIVQQNILSGAVMIQFINTILFGNDQTNYEVCKEALEANELLAKNVSVYLINTKIPWGDLPTFFRIYNEVKLAPERLQELTDLLKIGQKRLEFGFDESNPARPSLCLFYKKPGTTDKIRLALPELPVIEAQQMLYSNDLIALLAAKQKAVFAMIDMRFFRELSNQQASIYKEIFFVQ